MSLPLSVRGPVAVAATAALAAALAVLAVPRGGRETTAPGAATVVRVIDGDTLVVALGDGGRAGGGETVRLIGVDTPESVARDRPVECWGAEASRELAGLVPPGTRVRLVRDVEARDRYGRLLAYLHRADDGLFVNRALVAGGAAEAYEFPPNTAYSDDLRGDERAARAAGAGLWGACGSADVAIAGPPG